ncbi:MAG: hypothetical protein NVSMB4_05100 [Acidimicrobiales bacterium]
MGGRLRRACSALFEAEPPHDERPRALIARIRAFARGDLRTAEEIRRRFTGGVAADGMKAPVAAAAARAAGQAVATCYMGAHALGAAAYEVKAAGLADPDRPEAVDDEIQWHSTTCRPGFALPFKPCPPSVKTGPARSAQDSSLRANQAASSATCKPGWPKRTRGSTICAGYGDRGTNRPCREASRAHRTAMAVDRPGMAAFTASRSSEYAVDLAWIFGPQTSMFGVCCSSLSPAYVRRQIELADELSRR